MLWEETIAMKAAINILQTSRFISKQYLSHHCQLKHFVKTFHSRKAVAYKPHALVIFREERTNFQTVEKFLWYSFYNGADFYPKRLKRIRYENVQVYFVKKNVKRR